MSARGVQVRKCLGCCMRDALETLSHSRELEVMVVRWWTFHQCAVAAATVRVWSLSWATVLLLVRGLWFMIIFLSPKVLFM